MASGARTNDTLLNHAFGETLRTLRRRKRWSQERLAEESDVSRNQISLMERGIWGPSLYTVFRLARALDVSPGQLVTQVAAEFEAAARQVTSRPGEVD